MAKFISTFLSLLILLSSSGVSYAQHYCGELAVMTEITVGHTDLSCGMSSETEKGCCDNDLTKVSTDQNYSPLSFSFNFDNNLEALYPKFNLVYLFNEYDTKNEFFIDYSPPLLEQDLNILFRTFRI